MNTDFLIDYYNKFNEDKRLLSRHGRIEFVNTLRHADIIIDRILKENSSKGMGKNNSDIKILDIGAGTGAYSGYYSEKGYDVSAVELVKHNISRLKKKYPLVKAWQGNALNLKKFEDDSFDICLLFGPLYHLFTKEDKVRCLQEAKRVTKKGGYILAAYVMNEYSVIMYAFKENKILECIEHNRLSEDYHTINSENDLYDYVRIEDINSYNESAGLERDYIFTPDGAANYMREHLKRMTEEEFAKFVEYQFVISTRSDLIGAGAHTVDVLKVN